MIKFESCWITLSKSTWEAYITSPLRGENLNGVGRGSWVNFRGLRVKCRGSRVAGKLLRVAGKLSRVAGRGKTVVGPENCRGRKKMVSPKCTASPHKRLLWCEPHFLVRVHLFTITIPTKFSKFFALGSSLALKSSSISRRTSCNFLQNRLFSFVCFLLTCLQRASKNKNSF